MIQFASSRAPAAGVPYYVTGGSKVHNGQIKSNGPLEKCTPQSIVAATLSHGRPVCGRIPSGTTEAESGEVLAPNPSDSTEIDRVCRSDVVFIPNVTRVIARATNGQPQLDGFHALNGIPADYGIKFAGIATFTGIGNGEDQTQDNVGAANIAGTQTIINMGDKTIYAMQGVWASEHAYMVKNENGQFIPGVKEFGHHDLQFRPATFGMNYLNVTTIMKYIETEVEAIMRQDSASVSDEAGLISSIETSMRNMMLRVDNHKMPLYYYGFLYASHLIARVMLTKASMAQVNFICGQLDKFWEMKRRDRCKYDVPLDEGLGNMELEQKCENLFNKLENSNLPSGNGTISQEFVSWYGKILSALAETMKEVQAMQHDFTNAHFMGLALNTAEPGKPLDILLRCYHN